MVRVSNSLADTSSNIAKCNVSAVGINEASVLEVAVNIYPNPTGELITVSVSELTPGDIYTFSMYDQAGRYVKRIVLTEADTDVSLEDLSSGSYFFKIEDNNSGKAKAGTIVLYK